MNKAALTSIYTMARDVHLRLIEMTRREHAVHPTLYRALRHARIAEGTATWMIHDTMHGVVPGPREAI